MPRPEPGRAWDFRRMKGRMCHFRCLIELSTRFFLEFLKGLTGLALTLPLATDSRPPIASNVSSAKSRVKCPICAISTGQQLEVRLSNRTGAIAPRPASDGKTKREGQESHHERKPPKRATSQCNKLVAHNLSFAAVQWRVEIGE